jgi:alpha-1,2-mannosyltransferase
VKLGLRALPLLVIAAIAIAIWQDVWNRPEPMGIDYHTYLAAARVGLEQGWSHIYDQGRVDVQQKLLVPDQTAQPFLSPPTDAWLVAPLTPLPYLTSYWVWAALTFGLYVLALAWSSIGAGLSRWLLLAAAIAPWWLLHGVRVGQVVPIVAAGVVIAWRLLREDRDVAAGLVLSVILLKPNIAFMVPLVLLVAGRYRAFAGFAAVATAVAVVALLTLGFGGISDYINQLRGPLPPGADSLTLERALGAGASVAVVARILVVVAAVAAAFRLRLSPGMVIAAGILGSLLTTPYLHASDLCLLIVAAWIVWQERSGIAWRVGLVVGWVLASPFVQYGGIGSLNPRVFDPRLDQWPLLELVFLAGMVAVAWSVDRVRPADKVVSAT